MDQSQGRLSGQSAWKRLSWLWDVYLAAVYGFVVVSLVADQGTTTTRRLLAIVA